MDDERRGKIPSQPLGHEPHEHISNKHLMDVLAGLSGDVKDGFRDCNTRIDGLSKDINGTDLVSNVGLKGEIIRLKQRMDHADGTSAKAYALLTAPVLVVLGLMAQALWNHK